MLGWFFIGEMVNLNIEIKAKCDHPALIRDYLNTNNAVFRGLDQQTDTYFNVVKGRLKLREGNIENNLIYYERNDEPGLKESNFQSVQVTDPKRLKEILQECLGIKIIVYKKREIYFIDNVKFHIDEVTGLGNFVEIEASNLRADVPKAGLQQQCDFYLREFRIKDEDLIAHSYSDLLLGLQLSG